MSDLQGLALQDKQCPGSVLLAWVMSPHTPSHPALRPQGVRGGVGV